MKNKFPSFDPNDFGPIKRLALSFPGAEESLSHEGTPSVKVNGKLMCRLHESGAFIPIRLDFAVRDRYLEAYPELFHLPDHFRAYPYLCLWVQESYPQHLLAEVLLQSWTGLATKKQLKERESGA